ncbi:MAG: cation diffusion facilitator family transporter [[Actinobacillus] rossii]|nr:cation diffusion facilitator family transporter [[Actinobacillus] rossii]MDY5793747.1 cation diffusion facilitator family transporter [[Actinobacillus] rossii]
MASSDSHHDQHIPKNKTVLTISFSIIVIYMFVEFVSGYYFNSLTLMADAGHMANDSFSLLLALIALFLTVQKQKYFALLNGLSLILVAVMILWEAFERFGKPTEMLALPMLSVAIVGLLVNILVAWLMLKGDHENLNIKAAYLHVLADLLGSVVAIIAGLATWLLGWQWVDIVASSILSLLVLKSGLGVSLQALKLL